MAQKNSTGIFEGILLSTVLLTVVGLVIALPVMWLWNWLMPAIFGLVKISFWQALGLTFLCSMLFKSSNTNSK